MGKKLLLRAVTAVLLLGLAAALAYVGAYGYTTWRTDDGRNGCPGSAAAKQHDTRAFTCSRGALGHTQSTRCGQSRRRGNAALCAGPRRGSCGHAAGKRRNGSGSPPVSTAASPEDALLAYYRTLAGKTRTWQGGSALRTRRCIIP